MKRLLKISALMIIVLLSRTASSQNLSDSTDCDTLKRVAVKCILINSELQKELILRDSIEAAQDDLIFSLRLLSTTNEGLYKAERKKKRRQRIQAFLGGVFLGSVAILISQ